MQIEKVKQIIFSELYPHYLKKVENKGRSEKELKEVIRWFTSYSAAELNQHIKGQTTLEEFFKEAKLNSQSKLIFGKICGVNIEDIQDPFFKKVRKLDKIIDELAKGKSFEAITSRQTRNSA